MDRDEGDRMSFGGDRLTQWSFSKWQVYERCPFQAALKFIRRLPEAPSQAMARGEAMHKLAERYIKKEIRAIPGELKPIAADLRRYRRIGATAEMQFAFTDKWTPTGWFASDAWCRVKIDVLAVGRRKAEAVDWKTGRPRDDGAEYQRQLELYAVGAMSALPKIQSVSTRLVFIDHEQSVPASYSREQLPALQNAWTERVAPMLSDRLFPPRPGAHCRWCSYRKAIGGPCEY